MSSLKSKIKKYINTCLIPSKGDSLTFVFGGEYKFEKNEFERKGFYDKTKLFLIDSDDENNGFIRTVLVSTEGLRHIHRVNFQIKCRSRVLLTEKYCGFSKDLYHRNIKSTIDF